MAKQVSPVVKLRGTIDDLNFYISEDGFMAREKGGVTAERIKNDPKFLLTRLNGLEFGTGGKAGKLFRSAWKPEIAKAADNRLTSRITKAMVKILQTDPTSDYGYRKVENGDPSTLAQFEFNVQAPLATIFEPAIQIAINRAAGQAVINLPEYNPARNIIAPDGATHYSIFAAVAAINFAEDTVQAIRQSTANLVYQNTEVAPAALTLTFAAASPYPVFILMGIEFLKFVNGKSYEMSKGQNALQVIAVDVP